MLATSTILNQAAEELLMPEDALTRKGLHSYLERQLRLIQVEIFEIISRYHAGTLDEAGFWRDYQRLDHLEYKRTQLQNLLDALI